METESSESGDTLVDGSAVDLTSLRKHLRALATMAAGGTSNSSGIGGLGGTLGADGGGGGSSAGRIRIRAAGGAAPVGFIVSPLPVFN